MRVLSWLFCVVLVFVCVISCADSFRVRRVSRVVSSGSSLSDSDISPPAGYDPLTDPKNDKYKPPCQRPYSVFDYQEEEKKTSPLFYTAKKNIDELLLKVRGCGYTVEWGRRANFVQLPKEKIKMDKDCIKPAEKVRDEILDYEDKLKTKNKLKEPVQNLRQMLNDELAKSIDNEHASKKQYACYADKAQEYMKNFDKKPIS